jgi:NAD(P)-dependent dehydrogenase (short-subunit alcohol dehydrogenase family)
MKAVVVTGVSTGIGWGIVKVLASKGFHVFGSVRKQADADRLKESFGKAFTPLLFDVTDEDAVSAGFTRARQGFRYEFVHDPDEAPSAAAARAVDALIGHGALARDADGHLNVADDARLDEIAVLIVNFVESYRLVARAAASGAAGARDLPRAALALGRTLVTSGQIARDESLNLVNLENATRALGEDGPTVFTERLDAVAPRAPTL